MTAIEGALKEQRSRRRRQALGVRRAKAFDLWRDGFMEIHGREPTITERVEKRLEIRERVR